MCENANFDEYYNDEFYGYPVRKESPWTGVLYLDGGDLHLCLGICGDENRQPHILSVQLGNSSKIHMTPPTTLINSYVGVVPNRRGVVRAVSDQTVEYTSEYGGGIVSDTSESSRKQSANLRLGDLIIHSDRGKLEYVVGWQGDLLWTIIVGESGARYRELSKIDDRQIIVWHRSDPDSLMPPFKESKIGLPMESHVLDKRPWWRRMICV